MKIVNNIIICFLLNFMLACVTPAELDYLDVNKDIHVLDEFNYDYKVKTGDLLSVQIKTITPVEFDFFNQTKESNSQLFVSNPYLYGYVVNSEGYLELPIIGSFNVRGKTISEVSFLISDRSKSYFKDPTVKVNMNISIKKIFLLMNASIK